MSLCQTIITPACSTIYLLFFGNFFIPLCSTQCQLHLLLYPILSCWQTRKTSISLLFLRFRLIRLDNSKEKIANLSSKWFFSFIPCYRLYLTQYFIPLSVIFVDLSVASTHHRYFFSCQCVYLSLLLLMLYTSASTSSLLLTLALCYAISHSTFSTCGWIQRQCARSMSFHPL